MAATQHRPGSLLGSLLALVGLSAVAGLLVAATLTPALAVASNATSTGVEVFENLPSYAQITQQAERNRIYGNRDGKPVEIAQFYSQDRQVLSWGQVPRVAVEAAIAGEDRRFYTHAGVDAPSVVRAALADAGISNGQGGASTLTMQLVRQQIAIDACLTDTDEAREICAAQYREDYQRKLAEMRLAMGLEQRYTKNEIVLAYLNIANFGGNIYGIESGAQRAFGKTAADLSIGEAASLLATVQHPSQLSLFKDENFAANQVRRDFIIRSMADEGFITAEQRDAELAIPVDAAFVNRQPANNGCISGIESTRFFCDYVQRELAAPQLDDAGNETYTLAASRDDNARVLAQGGLKIYTSIDVDLNDEVQQTVDRYVPNDEDRWESGAAVTQLEVTTGRILTMAQNKDYSPTEDAPPTATSVNFNADSSRGISGGFQPGSAFKIFTLAQWIIDGRSVNQQVDSRQVEWRNGDFTASCDPSKANVGSWRPQNNEGNQYSRMSATEIMVNSINTGTLRMASEMDLCDIMDTASRMGVKTGTGGPLEPLPSAVIGGAWNTTPLSMAQAFQTIANGGVHCEPRAIDRIVARDGSDIAPPPPKCETALTPEVASVMQLVLETVTNRNRMNNPPGPTPVISKTGTSNNVVQTWLNGASPTVATAVWIGNIKGNYSLVNRWDLRSSVFVDVMSKAIARYPGGEFLTPDAATVEGDAVELPNVAGKSIADAEASLKAAGFPVEIAEPVEGLQDEGLVEYTAPGAGAQVSKTTPIILYPSNGELGVEPDEDDTDEGEEEPAGPTWPDLTGQALSDARSTVDGAGFDSAGIQVTWQDHGDANLCRVLAQNPLPGSTGDPADPISVVVGTNVSGGDPGC